MAPRTPMCCTVCARALRHAQPCASCCLPLLSMRRALPQGLLLRLPPHPCSPKDPEAIGSKPRLSTSPGELQHQQQPEPQYHAAQQPPSLAHQPSQQQPQPALGVSPDCPNILPLLHACLKHHSTTAGKGYTALLCGA